MPSRVAYTPHAHRWRQCPRSGWGIGQSIQAIFSLEETGLLLPLATGERIVNWPRWVIPIVAMLGDLMLANPKSRVARRACPPAPGEPRAHREAQRERPLKQRFFSVHRGIHAGLIAGAAGSANAPPGLVFLLLLFHVSIAAGPEPHNWEAEWSGASPFI